MVFAKKKSKMGKYFHKLSTGGGWLLAQSCTCGNASYLASILRRHAILGERLEARAILYESELHPTRGAVALLGNDEFSFALQIRIVLLIDLFAEYEGNHVGVLLNRSRFPQVGQLWTVIAATALRGATQLRQRDDRNCELLRQGLQAPGNG